MSVQPGTRLGHYEILTAIGKGGMGEVWKARDTTLRRYVAIKTLPAELARDAERLTRLEREAELLATLNHPNVATIHGLEAHDGTHFLVLELVEGDTLDDRIRRGAIPVHDSIALALQIAQGLEAAHQQSVIHRDLKPANIKITPDGRIKVLDFGLGKALAPPADALSTHAIDPTEAGIVMGTPAYMSPEQARGEAVGVQADIWSFGAVLYEMLTGRSPFARQTLAETLASVLDAQPDYSALPMDTPPLARRLIERCLAKDPKRRLQHMGDVRIDLEDALALPGSPSDVVSTTTVAGGVPRRKALIYGASSLALLASGLAGGVLLDRRLQSTVPSSFRRLTFRRGVIRSARFSPDGQTIYYGALWDGDRCRVHSVRVDNPESRPLDLPDANVLAISRSGDVALALGSHLDGGITAGTLARVPIAGGAPRPMLEDVRFADWSPDGSDLAIVRRVDGRDRLEFPIGKILVQPAVGESTGLGFARVSSDGRHVAFVHYRSPTSLAGKVGIVDQTGRVTALSNDYLNIHGLAWKGEEIWYTAADERPLFRALCAVTPGGKQRVITRTFGNATLWDVASDGRVVLAHTDDRSVAIARLPGDVNDRDLSWLDASVVADLSRDGRMLLFTETGQGGGAGFSAYLRGTDGSSAVRLGAGRAAALSPDTRWALGLSGTGPSTQLDLLPTGVGEARRIPGNGLAYTTARWLPDGNRIIISAAEPGQQLRLYVQELEQGRRHPLTPVGVTSWAISPEGSMIAARGPGPMIRIYPVDGTAPRDVTGLTGREVPVGWISDGLLVMRPGDASSPLGEVYRVDLKTGQLQSWRNILPRDRAGILNFMSFRVTPDGRTQAYSWHRALSNLYVADGLE